MMMARLACWWTIFRIGLEERLVYRGDFALGTLMRFLPIVTQVFLWWAIFQARGLNANWFLVGEVATAGCYNIVNSVGSNNTLAGYTYEDFVAYYLLTMVSRAFSSMPGLASGIAKQIRSGEVKKFLVQPIDLLGFLFLNRLAHKVAYYAVAVLPFAFVFYLCRSYFNGWPDSITLAACVASLLMSFLLGFYMEACLGLVGFWFLEVSSLLFVYMLFSFFMSGHMFPLDMLPPFWQQIVNFLPLRYLAYFPAAVFLEKITGWELLLGLASQAGWTGFFVVLSRFLYAAGLRRYSAFGG